MYGSNGLHVVICGGNWNNGVHCGPRTVNVNNYPWNVNTNIGARLACDDFIAKTKKTKVYGVNYGYIVVMQIKKMRQPLPPAHNCLCQSLLSEGLRALPIFNREIKMEFPKYSDVYNFENLYQAAKETISDKKYFPEELRFTEDFEENLIEKQNELIWHTYRPGFGREFYVYDPKMRLIYAPELKDRIVHTAVCRVVEPFINSKLDFDSYACRVGKGTLAAANRAAMFANKYSHFVYFDISKFFDSVPILRLEEIFRKRFVQDDEILYLLHTIFMHEGNGVGLKKGCRTSQLAANVYLNELDHFIRHILKAKAYVRYMDDFIIFSDDVEYLKKCWRGIENFLQEELFLTLNKKTYIGEISRGFEFVGYMIYPKYKIVRKIVLDRASEDYKKWKTGNINDDKFYRAVASRVGHCEGTSSYKWFCDYLLKILKHRLIDEKSVKTL